MNALEDLDFETTEGVKAIASFEEMIKDQGQPSSRNLPWRTIEQQRCHGDKQPQGRVIAGSMRFSGDNEARLILPAKMELFFNFGKLLECTTIV